MRFENVLSLGVALLFMWGSSRAAAQAPGTMPMVPAAPPPISATPERVATDPIYRELAVRKQLQTVRLEQARLLAIDRELQPLTGPKVAMIAGFAVTGALVLTSMSMSSQQEHDLDGNVEQPSTLTLRLMGATMVAGMVTGFTGLGFLLYRVRHRPHRAEALRLRQRERELRRELDQLIHWQEGAFSLAPSFSYAESRVGLQLRGHF